MTSGRRSLFLFSILAVIALVGVACGGSGSANSGVDVGQRPPDVELSLLGGETGRLSQWQGQPVVINFWASWCAPCRAEMPEIVEAYQAHRDEGLVVVGVNVQESEEKAVGFAEEFAMTFPVALDARGELLERFQVRGLPTTIFINRDGEITVRWAGILTAELLDQYLAEIM